MLLISLELATTLLGRSLDVIGISRHDVLATEKVFVVLARRNHLRLESIEYTLLLSFLFLFWLKLLGSDDE